MEACPSMIENASELRSKRLFDESIDLFTKLIGECVNAKRQCSKQDLASAYNEHGFTKYLAVDFDGAIEDYTRAIDVSQCAVYYYNRAVVHYRLARFQQAVDDTSRALTLHPQFTDALRCQNQAKIDGKLRSS